MIRRGAPRDTVPVKSKIIQMSFNMVRHRYPATKEGVLLLPRPSWRDPVLWKALGSGRGDPFDASPVKLSPRGRALLDHCKWVYFSQWNKLLISASSFVWLRTTRISPGQTCRIFALQNANIQPGVFAEPSAFHMILGMAANYLAVLDRTLDSDKHRTAALNLVEKNALGWKPDSSDDFLAADVARRQSGILSGSILVFLPSMRMSKAGNSVCMGRHTPTTSVWMAWRRFSNSKKALSRFKRQTYSCTLL
jgi:hypothetical protein